METARKNTTTIIVIGTIIIAITLIASTLWMNKTAREGNEEAARTVSILYLDELAGRREQVVENNLQSRIRDLKVAIELMDEESLSDLEHMQAYQARMKRLYNLEKFAFVDTDGLIYTSLGYQNNISDYNFDYNNISGSEILILNLNSVDKKVIIAVPVDMEFEDKKLCVCFMEIDMDEMLTGVSMESTPDDAIFCNIYTNTGVALSNTILGGLAVEDNLLEALKVTDFEENYSYEQVLDDYENFRSSVTSLTYNGIKDSLSYVQVKTLTVCSQIL